MNRSWLTITLVSIGLGLAVLVVACDDDATNADTAPGTTATEPPDTTNVCEPNPGPVDPAGPDIVVDSPSSGQTVTSPLTVTGQARTFEATVQLALFGADGEEIATTFGTAAAPDAGVHGPFSIGLDFAVTGSTDALLVGVRAERPDGGPRQRGTGTPHPGVRRLAVDQ